MTENGSKIFTTFVYVESFVIVFLQLITVIGILLIIIIIVEHVFTFLDETLSEVFVISFQTRRLNEKKHWRNKIAKIYAN